MTHSTNNSSGSAGVSLIGVVQIVLIILKMCNLISWSWPIVLIPLWIWLGFFIIGLWCVLVSLLGK